MFFTQQFNGLKVVLICLRIVKVVISNNGTDCVSMAAKMSSRVLYKDS